ncbi:hypothetical protein [Methanofollis tationis]|nr:hypothetical protein [Methanofollis tationis]
MRRPYLNTCKLQPIRMLEEIHTDVLARRKGYKGLLDEILEGGAR